ncbi:hypothetical protein H6F74_25355 [Trichocoleus sp. FACHB-90]|uniref:hypothetical protein n=1 Tax=Cyanophyceae TaxID=3028117 RepID=UPI0016873DC2|nr:hypothetical protein [Trichocoleus sp. FACHB-90]MBD1832377.1 hypothetical protein [Cyanobacteria bacterium FACHB-472]MBD1929540.1 hypothetical protein [Trichocoleus sp. FACHB-90]
MRYFAEVQKNELSGGVELRILAKQTSENTWAVIDKEYVIPAVDIESPNDGWLVLVEVSENQQIHSIEKAKNWVLELVKQYLTSSITPTFLQQEAERAEHWRQDLTLQSQELARKNLEMEARREQIQTLEQDLEQKKKQLEAWEEDLKRRGNS